MPPAGRAVMTIALADGEAEAFFAPGQCFTIWADGTVGHTIRADGLAGYGVISRQMSPPPARLDDGRIRATVARPARRHRLPAGATLAGP